MKSIAALLIYNAQNEFLFYLRDDKPTIPFPHHWDLFGGHVEEGESVEEALKRELMEELRWDIPKYGFFREYQTFNEPSGPTTKYIYFAQMDQPAESFTLYEGERFQFFSIKEALQLKFSHIIRDILVDFLAWEDRPEGVGRRKE